MNVADLELGKVDALGSDEVACIYARKPPEYAVYRTSDRVLVHYADDSAKSAEQRKAQAQLAPLRGEINSLIDGWRSAPDQETFFWVLRLNNGQKLRNKAKYYDRRVGDALIVAFEGDIAGASDLLKEIKDDITEERVAFARFQSLAIAFFVAFFFVAIAGLVGLFERQTSCGKSEGPLCFTDAADLWRGAMAGACGSFFSIALAIRGRTILTDLNRTSNLMDAALRVTIGIIAGVVLVSLVLAGFVRIHLGESSGPDAYGPLEIAIVGFIAGFAERLVPDLLAKAEARTGGAPVKRKPRPQPEDEEAPRQPVAGPAGGPIPAPANDLDDPLPEQAHEDACVCDIDLHDDEVTADEDLPAASGGVANDEVRA